MLESAKQMQDELVNKNKGLEKENKKLSEIIEIANKSKMTEQGGLEKKLEKVMDERDRLSEELE